MRRGGKIRESDVQEPQQSRLQVLGTKKKKAKKLKLGGRESGLWQANAGAESTNWHWRRKLRHERVVLPPKERVSEWWDGQGITSEWGLAPGLTSESR
jgi:hypothetical protein